MRPTLVVLALLLSTAAGAQNFVVDPATVCRCDAASGNCRDSANRWTRAVSNQIETHVSDFDRGEIIGTACAAESAGWDNTWQPVDGTKRTLVGTFHHFNGNINADTDWNLHIIPDPAFAELITVVESRHPGSAREHDKCGGPSCLEGEIAPDRQFWTNPWFIKPGMHANDIDRNGISLLEGRTMGFYGPWITDDDHSSKAEIHPVSMMWWKDHFEGGFGNVDPFDVFWLMLLQDNTARFDDRDNYDCGGNTPPGWLPWAHAPVSGQFSIAFEVNPAAGEVMQFSIHELFKRFVMTRNDPAAMADADPGTTHDLQLGDRVVVSVREEQPEDDDLGVTFTDLCLRPDGRLQGFVTIRSKVGRSDDVDEEGFHVLFVTRALKLPPVPPRPPSVDLDGFTVTSAEIGDSIRGGPRMFLGNLVLTLEGATGPVTRVELAAGGTVSPIEFTQDPKTGAVLLPAVPLSDGTVHVTTSKDKTSFLGIPSIKPELRILGSWKETDLVDLTLETRYTRYQGESVSDGTSAFAGYVSDALSTRDPKILDALFHTEKPLTAEWSIEAIDAATGKPVDAKVEITTGHFGNETARVRLGEHKDAVEVRARATVTDANGQPGTVDAVFRQD